MCRASDIHRREGGVNGYSAVTLGGGVASESSTLGRIGPRFNTECVTILCIFEPERVAIQLRAVVCNTHLWQVYIFDLGEHVDIVHPT